MTLERAAEILDPEHREQWGRLTRAEQTTLRAAELDKAEDPDGEIAKEAEKLVRRHINNAAREETP